MKFTGTFVVDDNGFYLNEYDESHVYEFEKLEFNELEAALKWMVEKFETITKDYPIDPTVAHVSYQSGKETVSISVNIRKQFDQCN